MKVTRIEYVEYGSGTEGGTCYKLDAECLASDEFEELRDLLHKSGILLYQTQHRGPVHGSHELMITVEALDGKHDVVACDVAFSAEHQELSEFVKRKGTKSPYALGDKRPSDLENSQFDIDIEHQDLRVAS